MRILLANYRYFISGGPERYMFNVTDALQDRGHEIIPFSVHYTKNIPSVYSKYFVEPLGTRDEVLFQEQRRNIKTFVRTMARLFYSPEVERAVQNLAKDTKPDIAYVLHYLRKLSPSLLVGLKKAKIPIVVRLSDYAMLCPQSHCLREEKPCELCVKGRGLLPSVYHICVQNSFAASTLNVLATWYHQARRYFDLIDVFVTTNSFMYDMMKSAGFEEQRLRCIPTFVNVEVFQPVNDFKKENYIIYAGRLEPTKGVHVLIDAMNILHLKRPDLKLHTKIVGSGDSAYLLDLQNKVRQYGLEEMVEFTGDVDTPRLCGLLAQAKLTVVPSLWYENLPNSMLESYACGTPVIASCIGSLSASVREGETGLLFEPGDPNSLAERLIYCFDNSEHVYEMAVAARRVAESAYAPSRHIAALEGLFSDLIKAK